MQKGKLTNVAHIHTLIIPLVTVHAEEWCEFNCTGLCLKNAFLTPGLLCGGQVPRLYALGFIGMTLIQLNLDYLDYFFKHWVSG